MSYQHFTPEERYVIYHLLLFGLSYHEIGRRLKRHHTSIAREAKRNGRIAGPYWNQAAQEKADQRKHKARHYRKRSNEKLFSYVTDKIRQDWSPEIISGHLQRTYPDDDTLRMSPEGIYRWIYEDARTLGTLYTHLVRHHEKRRKQRKDGSGRGLIPDRVSIDKRP